MLSKLIDMPIALYDIVRPLREEPVDNLDRQLLKIATTQIIQREVNRGVFPLLVAIEHEFLDFNYYTLAWTWKAAPQSEIVVNVLDTLNH